MPVNPDRAPRGGPRVRGPLIATFTFARAVGEPKGNGAEFGAAAGTWAVTDIGAAAGFAAADGAANRLGVPFVRPEAWYGLLPAAEVDGVPFGTDIPMPWVGGEVHNAAGIGGAVVPVSAAARLSLRTSANLSPCQIRVFGADTAVPAGTVIRLYAAAL